MDIFSSPSDGSRSCSTAPTTPSSSPLFRPSDIDDLKLAQLPQARLGESELRGNDAVRNVCVVGAGYVGRIHLWECAGRGLSFVWAAWVDPI